MHIPDGFLTTEVWAPLWALSSGVLMWSIKALSRVLKERLVPLMGVTAAFIFAAQMLNFPVAGGTSGHLLGGALAVILLGPYAACVIIATVLAIQCILFQDGGITAYGANVFNMAITGVWTAYASYFFIKRTLSGNRGIFTGVIVASWLSVVISSCICALELALSGVVPLRVVLPAMAGIHMLIGIGEAIITVLVVGFVLKVRPDLLYNKKVKGGIS